MSTFTSSGTTVTDGATSRARFALVGLATVVIAVVLNILVYYVGRALVSYDPDFVILQTVSPTITFTVVPAIIGVLLYAVLLRLAARPERTFTVVAVIVLLLSVVPDLTYIPTIEGASAGQAAVLVVMHVVAAAAIVGTLVTLAPSGRRRR